MYIPRRSLFFLLLFGALRSRSVFLLSEIFHCEHLTGYYHRCVRSGFFSTLYVGGPVNSIADLTPLSSIRACRANFPKNNIKQPFKGCVKSNKKTQALYVKFSSISQMFNPASERDVRSNISSHA